MGEKMRRLAAGGPLYHGAQAQQQGMKIDLSLAKQRICGCGGSIFKAGMALFTVPAVVSPNGQELLVQQPVIVCDNCGKHVANTDELLFASSEEDPTDTKKPEKEGPTEETLKRNSNLIVIGDHGDNDAKY
jgi:hypothetical protein